MVDQGSFVPNSTPLPQNMTQPQAAVAPSGGSRSNRKKMFVLMSVFLIVFVLGTLLYFVGEQQQPQPRAEDIPSCHNGTPPLPIDPLCLDEQIGCPSPREGFCKEKGACYECRFRFGGLRMICPCVPTQPISTPPIPPIDVEPTPTPEKRLSPSPTPPTKLCPVPAPVTELQITCPICQ